MTDQREAQSGRREARSVAVGRLHNARVGGFAPVGEDHQRRQEASSSAGRSRFAAAAGGQRRRQGGQTQGPPPPPPPLPPPRRDRATLYGHHARYSFRRRLIKLLCTILLSLLLIGGVLAFVLWLALRPHRPRFYIRSFSIPSLNQDNGFQNAQLLFDVTIRNSNQNIGIHYDAMSATVYYREQSIGTTPILFPFYQPPKNTTWAHGELSGATLTVSSEKWGDFAREIARGNVVFRLDLVSRIRFKLSTWDSHDHTMHASCDVAVGSDGQILANSVNKRCPVYFT
ncbi:hypothetical protein Scep_013063 [Stephania cephalantha]|uniref:Late embryogenesis abundant protein LEA-2 subgroup domain-containing protein n=1 Tax=Stephania cephalantha TaxID=152367 RepID=A0AAP0JH49_9MAGN